MWCDVQLGSAARALGGRQVLLEFFVCFVSLAGQLLQAGFLFPRGGNNIVFFFSVFGSAVFVLLYSKSFSRKGLFPPPPLVGFFFLFVSSLLCWLWVCCLYYVRETEC